jgi:hypothetical protein
VLAQSIASWTVEDEAEFGTGHLRSMAFAWSSAMLAYISPQSLTVRRQLLVALDGLAASIRARDPLLLVNLYDVPRQVVVTSKAASAFVA